MAEITTEGKKHPWADYEPPDLAKFVAKAVPLEPRVVFENFSQHLARFAASDTLRDRLEAEDWFITDSLTGGLAHTLQGTSFRCQMAFAALCGYSRAPSSLYESFTGVRTSSSTTPSK